MSKNACVIYTIRYNDSNKHKEIKTMEFKENWTHVLRPVKLQGSFKQVAWAESIREEMFHKIAKWALDNQKLVWEYEDKKIITEEQADKLELQGFEQRNKKWNILKNIESAKWFIENRNASNVLLNLEEN